MAKSKEELAAQRKAYREANREKILKQRREYRQANKEKIHKADKIYREANKEKIAEYNKAYRENNREKIAENSKTYREVNKEKIAEYIWQYRNANPIPEKGEAAKEASRKYASDWRKNNREKARENSRRGRARKKRLECGCVPLDIKQILIVEYGDSCLYCGGSFEHVDHFISLARGGKHCIGNLVPSCAHCNSSKSGRLIKYWKNWNGATPTLTCPNVTI